jgi:hypothetical protein
MERHQHKAFVNYLSALKPYCLQLLQAARELWTPLHLQTKGSVEQHGTRETEEGYRICGVLVKKVETKAFRFFFLEIRLIVLIEEIHSSVKVPCLQTQ